MFEELQAIVYHILYGFVSGVTFVDEGVDVDAALRIGCTRPRLLRYTLVWVGIRGAIDIEDVPRRAVGAFSVEGARDVGQGRRN